MTVSIEQMRPKLLTVDKAKERLSATEPLAPMNIGSNDKVQFVFEPDWALELDAIHEDQRVAASVVVNGDEFPLTKAAALQAGSLHGIQGSYMRKTPPSLIEPHLNYWYGKGIGENEYNALALGDDGVVSAFTKPHTRPFSNLELLDRALDAIKPHYDGEVLVDYKFEHSVIATNVRLILPEYTREIVDSNMFDVPGNDSDIWSAGIHYSNSLTGKSMTSFDGYLFRWWCTNGATTQLAATGAWNRRNNGQDLDDVYKWAQESVDEIFSGLDFAFEKVQALTRLDISHNLGEVLAEVFQTHRVPVSQRQQIIDELTGVSPVTMYHVQQAITRTANDASIGQGRADTIMRIGGQLSQTVFDPKNAKLWREGHSAPQDAVNPYEIRVN